MRYLILVLKKVFLLKLLRSYEKINNLKLKKKFGPNRDGDIPISYADVKDTKKLNGNQNIAYLKCASLAYLQKTNL